MVPRTSSRAELGTGMVSNGLDAWFHMRVSAQAWSGGVAVARSGGRMCMAGSTGLSRDYVAVRVEVQSEWQVPGRIATGITLLWP